MNNESDKQLQRLSERLPVHYPNDKLWGMITDGLNRADSEQRYEQLISDLPVHHPEASIWQAIETRLTRALFLRRAVVVTGIAASLLILFTFFRLGDNNDLKNNPQSVAQGITQQDKQQQQQQQQPTPGNDITSAPVKVVAQSLSKYTPVKPSKSQNARYADFILTEVQDQVAAFETSSPAIAEIPVSQGNIENQSSATSEAEQTNPTPPAIVFDKDYLKNTSPLPLLPEEQHRGDLSLAIAYLPEPINTGSGNALMHNMGIAASITRDNFRIQSGLGMAYNNSEVVYDLNYTQMLQVPIAHPGGPNDTTNIRVNNSFSELKGNERHQYLTYDLGVGRKLYETGKFSAWVNAGAGLAWRLDKSDLRSETIDKLEKNYNMQVSDIQLDLPSYNRFNVNLMTGIDLNYALIKRLSFTFTPLGRLYLKPITETETSASDPFTFGFRTGMKFDF